MKFDNFRVSIYNYTESKIIKLLSYLLVFNELNYFEL